MGRALLALAMAAVLAGGCAPPRGGGERPAPQSAPRHAAPAPGGEAAPPAGRPVTLAVVGDIMLARGVGTAIARHGVEYPFAAVAERLRAADYAFANLESPLGVRGRPIPGKGIWFRARPEAVEGLIHAGIDGVTVANNHILDYDTENFLETLALLRERGIGVTGGGEDLAAARRPLVADVGGVRVAFLGYSLFADLFWDWGYRRPFSATASRPGVAPLREETLAEDIARARALADVVAVAYHWGEEYAQRPTAAQRRLARRTVDLGADLVLGFHPHALQGIERYRGGLIAYSLGNFVMDDQRREVARESVILEVQLTRAGVAGYRVLPARIAAGQPRLLEGEAGRRLLDKLERLSAELAAAGPAAPAAPPRGG